MRISDWSSDVCSSDLPLQSHSAGQHCAQSIFPDRLCVADQVRGHGPIPVHRLDKVERGLIAKAFALRIDDNKAGIGSIEEQMRQAAHDAVALRIERNDRRSEEHTSDLQPLMSHTYCVL